VDSSSGGTISTTDDVFGDPSFVGGGNPFAAYHVQVSSAAIDAGVDASLDVDIDGEGRPYDTEFDIGADEYPGLTNAPATMSITGPITGMIQTEYTFTATVSPITTTPPITYVWLSTDQEPLAHLSDQSDAASFIWHTTGTQPITVTATNAGGTVTGTHAIMIYGSHGLVLSTGWNLVSWPLAPITENLTDTVASLGSACDEVWAYDAWDDTDPWKQWPEDLAQADETMGLWMRVTEPVTLTIHGWQPASPSIDLREGWNLVGYPSQTARPVAEALASIDGFYTVVQTFDPADPADPWKRYDVSVPVYANDLALMEPGRGYWIYVTTACILSIVP
jgi:hypothetical protein